MSYEAKDLIIKLKALAERGVGGEQTNAQAMLEKMLDKHGITLDDLDSERKYRTEFRYAKDMKKLAYQIINSVLGNNESIYYFSKTKKQVWIAYCTEAQKVEIQQRLDHYIKAYRKELEIFLYAFINKNHLFPSEKKAQDQKELTTEEKERIKKILKAMNAISDHTMIKMID